MKTKWHFDSNQRCLFLACLICLLSMLPNALPAQFNRRRSKHIERQVCYFYHSDAAFWQSEGDLDSYITQYLAPVMGAQTRGELALGENSAKLTVNFLDNVYSYCGSTPVFDSQGDLLRVGPEWIGIDEMIDEIVNQLILDGTSPDLDRVMNMENAKCLGGPLEVGILQRIQPTEEEWAISALMLYEGEFGAYHDSLGQLSLQLRVDDRDTTLRLTVGDTLNFLELGAIKAFAIQEALRASLLQYCGPEPPGLATIAPQKRGIFPIVWKPILLLSAHPNLEGLCYTGISLQFSQRPVLKK